MSVFLPRAPSRRTILRGVLGGAAVNIALPFLDCFLNANGTAVAATGKPLPVRFGTWFWGLGHTPGHSVADKKDTGYGIEFLEECRALVPLKDKVNFFSGFNTPLDGKGNYTHFSGICSSRTGTAASFSGDFPAPTLDLLIADAIGEGTRFQTIDATSIGIPSQNYSARSTNNRGAAEGSPMQLYTRLFGPGFVDPNKADFKPDPQLMVRKSVLSAMREQNATLMASVGSEDRARLDEYFTSIRQVENQLALRLEKPAPNEVCTVLAPPAADQGGQVSGAAEIETVQENHRIMTQMLAMAMACNQTKVINMVYSDNFSHVRKAGEATHHHELTHEENIDKDLGYQPEAFYFGRRSMDAWASFINALDGIKEGEGTLLDHSLIFASTETSYARIHSIDNLPIFTAGRAGGKVKTGIHVVGGGDPVSRIGLTAMRAMGVPIQSWGSKSLQTSKPISEILA